MATSLHVSQGHDWKEAPHMEAHGCGVEADIAGGGISQELATSGFVGTLFYETPVLQYVINIFQTAVLRQFNGSWAASIKQAVQSPGCKVQGNQN